MLVMDQKQIAALEISNKALKLVVGYVLEDKVNVLYATKRPLSVPFKDGDIFDLGNLSEDLSKIKVCESNIKNSKLTFDINEVSLVLPSYGLNVYCTRKETNTISNVSKIDKIDISNVLALVKKEKLQSTNDILVDIIPNYFVIEGNQTYLEAPIGKTSSFVFVDANVYTLPRKMVTDMKTVLNNAGMKATKEIIAPIGISQYFKNLNFKHETYMLIDFGAKTTTISFIGKGTLYGSNFFSIGVEDLVDIFQNRFQITHEQAEEIKDVYGLDARKTSYSPTIASGIDVNGQQRNYGWDEIHQIAEQFLQTWVEYLRGSLENLYTNSKLSEEFAKTNPLVFIGEGTSLNGLKDYLLKHLTSNPLEMVNLNTIGASDDEYLNCIAAIYASTKNVGTIEEDRNFVNSLSREKHESKQNVTRERYDELKDEL
jgi:cell division ATPase FtsA